MREGEEGIVGREGKRKEEEGKERNGSRGKGKDRGGGSKGRVENLPTQMFLKLGLAFCHVTGSD